MIKESYPYSSSHTEHIYILDRKGFIIDLNSVAIRKTGYSRDEIVGLHIKKLFTTDSNNILNKKFQKIMDNGDFEADWYVKMEVLWMLTVQQQYSGIVRVK